jgi:hypothetical protein
MVRIELNEALCLLMGRQRETAHRELSRKIADQNSLRKRIIACASELGADRRFRWLLRSFLLDHVPQLGALPQTRPTPRWWPPEELVACIDHRRRRWPSCVDEVRHFAAELARKWADHAERQSDAEERLFDAAREGRVRLFYRDNGMNQHRRITQSLLQEPLSITRDRLNLETLRPPSGPPHRALNQSEVRHVFHNVLVALDDIKTLTMATSAALQLPPLQSAPPASTGARGPTESELKTWYDNYRQGVGKSHPTEAEQVKAVWEAFPKISGPRGRLRDFKKRHPELTPRRGRPTNRGRAEKGAKN